MDKIKEGRRGRRRGRKNKRNRGRRGRRGRVIKILIVGNFTIDLISEKEQIGGPPLYSGFAIYKLGGEAYILSVLGKDFSHQIPNFLRIYKIIDDNNTVKFKHLFQNNSRKLILLSKTNNKINFKSLVINNYFDGILINPVCNEVNLENINVNVPIAVDIQGFIRTCKINEEISYSSTSLPPNPLYTVFHSNIEELNSSGLSVEDLFKLGFKELLISYDEEGFELYTINNRKYFKPTQIGAYRTGTGDILLASYFYYRLNNLDPIGSAIKAKELVEWFSNLGYQELLHIM
ncbi:hypothetical protein EWF20_01915 [Sulfolobus sp. S-194]|uniref:hypothetical protein n=1 Tax=Sulfolobus sp. S-194 TaxID=2512240 RepID=UPI001436F165|nr:hypothetical protein [Sulfolobus sp. S-194]QIW23034.1 hypothetical protein EWF20_01915 [Sulfolobus sp. S-194]